MEAMVSPEGIDGVGGVAREPAAAEWKPPRVGRRPRLRRALTYTGAAFRQARSNQSLGLRAPKRVGAGEPSGETSGSRMEAALVVARAVS